VTEAVFTGKFDTVTEAVFTGKFEITVLRVRGPGSAKIFGTLRCTQPGSASLAQQLSTAHYSGPYRGSMPLSEAWVWANY
jgi:hypothetical protein